MGEMRGIAAVGCGFVAVLFLLMAAELPFQLHRQAQQNRAFYQQFRQAAAHATDYAGRHQGQLPDDEALRRLGDTSDARGIWASLTSSDGDCDGDFRPEATDRFTLRFWRGEWSECFAYPSGKTTLHMSLSAYLRSGMAWDWAIYWLIAIAAAYGAFRLARPRQCEQAE
jgi:hypothetical protein